MLLFISVSCFHELFDISMLTQLSSTFWAFWLLCNLLYVTAHILHMYSYPSINSSGSRDRMQFVSSLNFEFSFFIQCFIICIWLFDLCPTLSIYKLFLRRSPEFIIPYNQYVESTKNNYSIGMKVQMKFEGEEGQEER